jgi:hypothetical protein
MYSKNASSSKMPTFYSKEEQMKKLMLVLVALAMVGVYVNVSLAEDGFYSESLSLADEMSIGNYIVKVYTKNNIDVSVLLEDIDVADDSEGIRLKIDSKRKDLYPDEEIAVNISTVEREKKSSDYINLINAIYAWNNTSSAWTASYYCNVATCFIHVRSGAFELQNYYNGYWHDPFSVGTNGSGTAYSHGNYNVKGFYGYGSGIEDIVIYFFY